MNNFEIPPPGCRSPAYRQAGAGSFTLYNGQALCYRKSKESWIKERNVGNSDEVREESQKIRYLRFLVDFSILSIEQDNVSLGEALKVVEDVKRVACTFFPGKEETFELIYRPRFNRVIQERFGTTAPTS